MADNVAQSIKDLKKSLEELDSQLLRDQQGAQKLGEMLKTAMTSASGSVDQFLKDFRSKLGAKNSEKLRIAVELTDKNGKPLTAKLLSEEIKKVKTVIDSQTFGSKSVVSIFETNFKGKESITRQYKELLDMQKMFGDPAKLYDEIMRMMNKIGGVAKKNDGTALGKARAAEMKEVQKYTKLANDELARQQKIEDAIAKIKERGGKSAKFEGEKKSLQELNDMLTESKRKLEEYKRALGGLGSRGRTAAAGFGGGDGSVKALRDQEANFIRLNKLMNQRRELLSKMKNGGTDAQRAEYKALNSEIKTTISNMRQLEARFKGITGIARQNTLYQRIHATNQSINRLNGSLKKTKATMDSMLPTLRKLASAFGVAFSVQGIVQFGKKLIETRGEFELQQVALRSILQNKQVADEIWDKTMQAALQSPFKAMQLVRYTKQLAAYRIETDKLFDTTKRLADVSAGLGVDMGRLILAYGQVKAANYLRASEIRQFTEAGVNILGELSTYFSETRNEMVSTAQVMDMVQKRMVKFEDVEAIFKRMTDQGGIFYNMQYVQSQTVKGQINKLHDAYDQMLNSIGKSNEGTLKDFVAALNNIVKNWRTWAVVIKSIGSAAAIGFITKYTMAITGLGKASMSTMRTMVKLRATVRSLSISWPMLATAGIAAVISTLVSLSKRMEEANKQIDEQNLRLFETRNNFADLKARIEENNRVIKENKSTTETLNKAQSDNKSIMAKLKNEYPDLAERMGVATNGIIEMNNALDINIRKLNEQMMLISQQKQSDWFSDTDKENLEQYEADLSTITTSLITAQSKAREQMMNLELAGDTTSEQYETLKKITELDLSKNILDARDAFLELAKVLGAYNDNWFVQWAERTQTYGKTSRTEMSSRFGISADDLKYPFDEKNVKKILDKESAALKEYYFNGIKDNEEYLKEINEKYDGDIIKWISRNADKINQGTLDGINKANETLIKVLNPQTPAFKAYINRYYNQMWGLIDTAYIETLRKQLGAKRAELMRSWTVGLQGEVDELERRINAIVNGVDLTSTANPSDSSTETETPEEKQSKIDAAWRRRISLLEEMKKRYDELAKSAYGYAKSNTTVRKEFEKSWGKIFGGVLSMNAVQFTSAAEMEAAFNTILAKAGAASDAVKEEIQKKADSYGARIPIDVQVRIREDFGRQIEDAFSNYELTLELQKLNLPRGLAAQMWGIEETDLQDLRARLTKMYDGLRDENGQFSEDAFKDYEKYLDKIDDLERKRQRERLKDYSKYLEYQYSERAKLEMEYLRKVSLLMAESNLTSAQKASIRDGLDKEFKEASKKQDWEDFKGSEFYVEMMEDLEKQGTASLEVMREKLLEMRANAENLSPRALKEVVKALEKIDEIENQRNSPLKRLKDASNALGDVNMKDVYAELAANQKKLAMDEQEERDLERMIMLTQERNKLEEQGVSIKEATLRLSQAMQSRDFAQDAYDAFKSDGSKESQSVLASLKQSLNVSKEEVEKWEKIVGILSGQAVLDEQKRGNKYSSLSLSELKKRRDSIKESIKELEGVIGKEEELVRLNKELNDAWDATLESIKNWAQAIQGVFDGAMDLVDYFTDSTYGMVSAWKEFGDTSISAISDLLSGIQKYRKADAEAEKSGAATGLFTANGLQLALVVLGVIMKIVQAIAKQHDAALDKEIQKQQEKIDALKDAYARLERQIEKTWTTIDYMNTYEQQVENIRAQIRAMEAQMAAERDKKDTDDNAVRQYQRDIQDAYDQLEELEQKSIEVFGGIGEEGYRSAAQGFVEAWKSAFLETGDGLQGLQDHFDEFLQNWFVNQATMQGVAKYYEKVFDYINSVVEDGSVPTYQQIENARVLADEAAINADEFMRAMAGIFGIGDSGSLSGLAAGIQGMTEEQANILEAYWNSVRMYTASIDMNVSRIAEMLGVGGANTNPLLQQMSLIAANTQATHQLLQSVTKSGHSQGGYGIKVFND